MRATDLVGLDVYDRAGDRIGVVIDLRCVQDGPLRGAMATLRVESLLVSRRRIGALLGYERHVQQGPWLLRTVTRRLHGRTLLVPWSAVRDHTGAIRVGVRRAELSSPTDQPGPSR
jgi:sporulation protein YlmC with PRC-barrel domain